MGLSLIISFGLRLFHPALPHFLLALYSQMEMSQLTLILKLDDDNLIIKF